jgi:hypothetical protein
MLPIAIVNNYNPVQVPLVNTTLPGTAATHVPYDNVSPPISNAQVNNNASPNSEAAAASEEATTAAAAQDAEEQASPAPNIAAQSQGAVAAPFLTQLMSQDGSVPAQVILVQYENMIAISNVKYKPSNALKPPAAPANVFGQILQQNKPAVQVQAPQPAQPQQQPQTSQQPAAAAPDAVAEETAVSVPAAAVAPTPKPVPTRITFSIAANTSRGNQPAPNAAAQIVSAYTEAASRLTAQGLDTKTEVA